MIGFFPKPYVDELAYSVFARYFERSGYICYTSCSEDLYVNPKNKPSIEFFNLLTNDAIDNIVPLVGSMENLILNHTMFNYYSAFLSNSNKHQAFDYALSMDIKALMNSLPIPKSKTTRYLRYCPLCAKEDRELYGETYWHRAHQVFGVNVCYKHGCYLVDSNVSISSNASPSLIKAESEIENLSTISKALPKEINFARYNIEILNHNYSSSVLENDLSNFLNSYLIGTPYLSSRGAKRYIETLSKDFKEYYKDINLYGFGEPWQLEKVFNGYRLNPFEICSLGLFLDVPTRELSSCPKPHKTQSIKDFDSHIRLLKESGLNYRQIANKVGLSYDYCKVLDYGKKSNKRKTITHNGGRKIDWDYLDEQTFPIVVQLIKDMESFNDARPEKISIGKIERLLELKDCQLKKLPKCLECVKAHTISQEEHWARMVAWSIRKLIYEKKNINKTQIIKLNNIRKTNIKRAIPYLEKYIDNNDLIEQVAKLICD